jgi:diguanylate cyclase (GGDEF)-like protein
VLEHLDLASLRSDGPLRETLLGGVHVIGAAQRIDLLDWHVAVLTPFDDAYDSVLTAVGRIFLIDLGVILVFSLLAYRVAVHVMRPFERLSDAVRRGAESDADAELVIPEIATRDEIGALSRTFARMLRQQKAQREEIEEKNRSLVDRNLRLEQANEVLNQLSITDGLTKLHNHRYFQDHLTREIRRVGRTGESLAILLLDIDDFKRLNDRHGHAAGDEILNRIAQILVDSVRVTDFCARYGGEEFVILAPNTDATGAYQVAEKVRTEVAAASFIVDDSMRPLRVTVSLGVAAFDGDRKHFFHQADQALYRAKAAGKDCVVAHGDDAEGASSF